MTRQTMRDGHDRCRHRRGALLLALLGLAPTSWSCSPSPVDVPLPYAPAEALTGRWQWVSSLDVKTQQLHTPESEGYQADLQFIAESTRSGRFIYRRSDGSKVVEGSFGIGSEDAPGNDFIVLTDSIDFLREYAWVGAGPEVLWLGGVYELGFNTRYARIPDDP